MPALPGSADWTLGALTAGGTGDGDLDISVVADPAGLAAGGDGTALVWSHLPASTNLWFTQTITTHDGTDALQSGGIAHNQSSGFSVTVRGRACSAAGGGLRPNRASDTLLPVETGSYADEISGSTGWTEFSAYTYSTGHERD